MPNVKRTPEEKLAILEAAKASGNIKTVCLQNGLSQTVFYIWRKKFSEGGIAALEHRKRWATHEPLPDFEVNDTDWVIKGLKRRSTLVGEELSPWYNFDLHVGRRWILRKFSYNREFRSVMGFNEASAKGRLYIIEPLGEVAKVLADSVQMKINLEHY